MDLTHIGLFSGIGGDALAARWAGFQTLALCEIDEYCRLILKRNWPDTIIWEDIRNVAGEELEGIKRGTGGRPVTVISGGYPCQGESLAGKRGGKADDRWLWPEMLRVIRALRPAWVIAENVSGHVTMGLSSVLVDLESAGYQAVPFVIPACAVSALHRRDRVFIVANSSCQQLEEPLDHEREDRGRAYNQSAGSGENVPHSNGLDENDGGYGASEVCGRRPSEAVISGCESEAIANSNGIGKKREESCHRTRGGTQQGGQGEHSLVANSNDRGLLYPPDKICSGRIPLEHGSPALAHSEGQRMERVRAEGQQEPAIPLEEALSRWDGAGVSAGRDWWKVEPDVGRMVNGISTRVDRYIHRRRLEALGNAIVPQQIYPIFRTIALIEGGHYGL